MGSRTERVGDIKSSETSHCCISLLMGKTLADMRLLMLQCDEGAAGGGGAPMFRTGETKREDRQMDRQRV